MLMPIVTGYRQHVPLLLNQHAFTSLLLLFQYLLVIPHELGHAIAARTFGFSNIRIFIGAGKPLFCFNLFGFDWLLNRIPFGGLTFARPGPDSNTRFKWIAFISAGLIVNSLFLIFAWLLTRTDFYQAEVYPSLAVLVEAFIWANVVVIVENLAPYTVQVGSGQFSTDGKLLLQAIFSWNKSSVERTETISPLNLWIARVLKALIAFVLGVCTLLLALFGLMIVVIGFKRGNIPTHVGIFIFFECLAAILGYYTYRTLAQPVAKRTQNKQFLFAHEWLVAILRTFSTPETVPIVQAIQRQIQAGDYKGAASECERVLFTYPDDLRFIVLQGVAQSGSKDYLSARESYERALGLTTIEQVIIYAGISAERLKVVMLQGDSNAFNTEAHKFLLLPIPEAIKVAHLDQIACEALFQQRPDLIAAAEFCIAEALKVAPASLTLKGTAGALLVEQGKLEEAYAILKECYDRSPVQHDQAISGLYLALIAEQRGQFKAAMKLARQSAILYPQPWLQGKAKELLARIQRRS
jgi:tetratricopeptide (TPR) repeat protein